MNLQKRLQKENASLKNRENTNELLKILSFRINSTEVFLDGFQQNSFTLLQQMGIVNLEGEGWLVNCI